MHEVSMSLKEPKQVKAVESRQSGGTRQKVLVRQRGGLVPYWRDKTTKMMKYATALIFQLMIVCH